MAVPEAFREGLEELCIDASSIIYLLKIGLLGSLAAEVRLVSTPQVIRETGWPHLPVEEAEVDAEGLTNDETLLALAEKLRRPVLSEDYEILQGAGEAGLAYYNTLMMLNYLYWTGRVAEDEYPEYLARLKESAHYSDAVLATGDEVYRSLREAKASGETGPAPS